MVITGEAFILILGILGTVIGIPAGIVGAFSYVSKRNADARVKALEINLIQAQTDLEEVKGDTRRMDRIMDALEKQQTINSQQIELRQKDREEAEQNYKVFKGLIEDVGQKVMDGTQRVIKEINTLPGRLSVGAGLLEAIGAMRSDYGERMAEFGHMNQTMISELGTIIARTLEAREAKRDMYPFPADDDPRWREVTVEAIRRSAEWIYKEPQYWDGARLVKSCAEITVEPQTARIIDGLLPDWIALRRTLDGVNCYGWVRKHFVRITEAQASIIPTS
jgi:hypothetical protein